MIIGTEFTDNKSPNDPFPAEWGKFSNIFAFIYLVYVVSWGESFYVINCNRPQDIFIIFCPCDNFFIIGNLGVGAYFGAQCEKGGMLVRVAGDNIMMCPPFIFTPEQVDEVRRFY